MGVLLEEPDRRVLQAFFELLVLIRIAPIVGATSPRGDKDQSGQEQSRVNPQVHVPLPQRIDAFSEKVLGVYDERYVDATPRG